VLDRLGAGEDGLSGEQAAERLERYGPNLLPRVAGPSPWRLLARQVASPLLYALLASAAVAIALGELEDGLVVLAVVVLNSAIGFVQEFRAGRAIAALADLVAEPAAVHRDGRWLEVPAEDVVPGDLVALAAGDRVPADVRLLHAEALRMQESALTGESAPVAKNPAPVGPEAPLGERRNVLFAGTTVTAGSGRGVAVATGPATELGRISEMLAEIEELTTPLTRELDRLGRAITALIGVGAVMLALVAAVRGSLRATRRWPGSAWRLPPSLRACPPWSRSHWRSASSGWPGGARSSVTCPRSRPSAAPRWWPRTRPALSRATR
jgi:magnesium-transporting ATPase (P-type)